MLPFGVAIPATVPQRSEIPGLMNYPVLQRRRRYKTFCWCPTSVANSVHR